MHKASHPWFALSRRSLKPQATPQPPQNSYSHLPLSNPSPIDPFIGPLFAENSRCAEPLTLAYPWTPLSRRRVRHGPTPFTSSITPIGASTLSKIRDVHYATLCTLLHFVRVNHVDLPLDGDSMDEGTGYRNSRRTQPMEIRPIRTDKDHRAALAEIEASWGAREGTEQATGWTFSSPLSRYTKRSDGRWRSMKASIQSTCSTTRSMNSGILRPNWRNFWTRAPGHRKFSHAGERSRSI
jgi:hypothetical protein